jgi:hypothetical protein
MTKELYRLTKEEAGSLTHDEASAMVGPWWFGNEGKERLDSKVGRQELHRVYLRNARESCLGADRSDGSLLVL